MPNNYGVTHPSTAPTPSPILTNRLVLLERKQLSPSFYFSLSQGESPKKYKKLFHKPTTRSEQPSIPSKEYWICQRPVCI